MTPINVGAFVGECERPQTESVNSRRGLTHSLATNKEGAAMKSIQPAKSRFFVNRPIPPEAARKYAEAYTVSDDGCWETTYSTQRAGYAFASWRENGHAYGSSAHRAAYTHHFGQIPDGMTVHHLCFNRACVNPDHLDLMSNVDNARRQQGADWPLGQCQYGHPDSMRKLYGKKKPVWRCGECVRIRNAMLTERAKQQRAEARAARAA